MICKECKQNKRCGGKGMCDACYKRWLRHTYPEKYRAYDRARWKGNRRETNNKQRKNNYENNKEHHLATSKKYHQEHYDEIRNQQSEYRAKNIEKIRERNRVYNQTKRDYQKGLARLKAWTEKQSKEKLRAIWVIQRQRRVAKIKTLPHTLTRSEWEQIKNDFNHYCAYCHKQFSKLTQDHVIPIARGGGYTKENIVPACKSCNSKKRTMTADEFIAKIKKGK